MTTNDPVKWFKWSIIPIDLPCGTGPVGSIIIRDKKSHTLVELPLYTIDTQKLGAVTTAAKVGKADTVTVKIGGINLFVRDAEQTLESTDFRKGMTVEMSFTFAP